MKNKPTTPTSSSSSSSVALLPLPLLLLLLVIMATTPSTIDGFVLPTRRYCYQHCHHHHHHPSSPLDLVPPKQVGKKKASSSSSSLLCCTSFHSVLFRHNNNNNNNNNSRTTRGQTIVLSNSSSNSNSKQESSSSKWWSLSFSKKFKFFPLVSSRSNKTNNSYNKKNQQQVTTTSSPPTLATSLTSASVFVVMDILFRRLFTYLKIITAFPSSLAGCGILFVTLLFLPTNKTTTDAATTTSTTPTTTTTTTTTTTNWLYEKLQPGAALLAQWLPVFFVPSLVTLPLANESSAFLWMDGGSTGGVGDHGYILEVFKVAILLIGGFAVSLLTTAASVLGIRKVVLLPRPRSSTSRSSSSSRRSSSSTTTTTATTTTATSNNNNKANNTNDGGATAAASPSSSSSSDNKTDSLSKAIDNDNTNNIIKTTTTTTTTTSTPSKPFSNDLFQFLWKLSLGSGLAAVAATSTAAIGIFPSTLITTTTTTSLTTLCLLSTTLASFVFGTRLDKSFTKFVHPLVTCTCLTWIVSVILGAAVVTTTTTSTGTIGPGAGFRTMLRAYRTTTGAGGILLSLLGPAVISLAVSMYDRRQLMRENMAEVATAILTATLGGVFGTAWAVRVLGIGNPTLRLSLLSRNITSPLAMSIASILGADVSLAVSFVVVTGLIGANFGANLLDTVGITDPVARGLGIGAAAHGLGTAAFANEKDAFPFAAIAMALTASAATVTVCIPIFKKLILQLALGY